jgi:adenylate cyclase
VSFLSELKRRSVLRVAAAYAVAGWLIIQIAETIFPLFGFDETPAQIVVIVLAIGFVPSLLVAWAVEWTPEGLRLDSGPDPGRSVPAAATRRIDRLIMIGLTLALAWFAFDRIILEPRRSAALVNEAREIARTQALVEYYGDKSIAVLPFDDMSPDGDQEYLSDGIAEELLNALAAVQDLRVISRTSSFAFRGQQLSTPEIASRLKVEHVLEGSVRKSGDQVRITTQLIHAPSDTHLWSNRWDGNLSDIFALQDEVAAAVANEMSTVLLESRSRSPAEALTPNELDAYELVLRGRHLMHQQTGETYTRAVPLFEQAIELAPDMAAAHGALALTLRQLVDLEYVEPAQAIPRFETALERALELDPDNVDALVAQGKALWQQDVVRARGYWLRAIDLNPSEPDARRYLAISYQDTDLHKFLDLMREAYSVDPTRWLTNYQLMHMLSDFGQYEEAIQLARDYHAMAPESIDPLLWYADVHYFRRQSDEALKSYYAVFLSDPEPYKFSAIPWVMLYLDRADLAESWARELVRRLPNSGYSQAPLIVALSFQGKHDEARQALADYTHNATDTEGIGEGGGTNYGNRSFLALRDGDFEGARMILEQGLTPEGESEPRITRIGDADWLAWSNYVYALERSGHPDRARELAAELLAMLQEQRKAGLIRVNLISTAYLLSRISAVVGNSADALTWLEQAAADEVLLCVSCIRRGPAFEPLRGNPRFEAVLEQVGNQYAAQRNRLAAEGLLLTPREVLALEDFDFDPFENDSAPVISDHGR